MKFKVKNLCKHTMRFFVKKSPNIYEVPAGKTIEVEYEPMNIDKKLFRVKLNVKKSKSKGVTPKRKRNKKEEIKDDTRNVE